MHMLNIVGKSGTLAAHVLIHKIINLLLYFCLYLFEVQFRIHGITWNAGTNLGTLSEMRSKMSLGV